MDRLFQIAQVPYELALKGEPLVVALLFCGILALGFYFGKGFNFAKRKLQRKEPNPIGNDELLK